MIIISVTSETSVSKCNIAFEHKRWIYFEQIPHKGPFPVNNHFAFLFSYSLLFRLFSLPLETKTFIISHSVGSMTRCNRIKCVTIFTKRSIYVMHTWRAIWWIPNLLIITYSLFHFNIIITLPVGWWFYIWYWVMFKYLVFNTHTQTHWHIDQWLATIKAYSIPFSVSMDPSTLPSIRSSVQKEKKWKRWKNENGKLNEKLKINYYSETERKISY